jgi:hypothetical protein
MAVDMVSFHILYYSQNKVQSGLSTTTQFINGVSVSATVTWIGLLSSQLLIATLAVSLDIYIEVIF